MLVKKYGSSIQSVETNFDSRALTEVGFRRDRTWSIPSAEFESDYDRRSAHDLSAISEGPVQDEAEQALLEDLQSQLDGLRSQLAEGEVLLIESEQGKDYPRTHSRKQNVIVDGENRLYFHCSVDPPLRVAVYGRP